MVARGQPGERVRRVGVLLPAVPDDREYQAQVSAFQQTLQQLGWTDGGNLRIEMRWATPNAAEIRKHATELVALMPDVILSHGSSTVGPLLQLTRTVPVVFPVAVDPVAAGLVDSLARPGGNATGFTTYEYGMAGKWLELLKQIAPNVTRVAVLRTATTPTGPAQFGFIQAAASSLGIEAVPINIRDATEIERTITAFSRSANDGLIITSGAGVTLHRELIIKLAEQHRLPSVYFSRIFVTAGGLASYGADQVDLYRRAANYVDRVLRGEKPADLPCAHRQANDFNDTHHFSVNTRSRGNGSCSQPRQTEWQRYGAFNPEG